MSGTLYGLGVGPGDPDLITLKARNVLQRVPVIAYPAPCGGTSLVRAIADPHIPAGRTEIVIETPMVADRFPAAEVYGHYARVISSHLEDGQDVAVLCEGDPFFYGSFMYLYERLAPAHETMVVAGVSSLGAVAAAAGMPLVSRDEVLCVIPATLDEASIERRVTSADAVALVKVGRHLQKVRRVITRLGLHGHAMYVERATTREQRVLPLVDVDGENAPYFSMILVAGSQRQLKSTVDGTPVPKGAALVTLTAAGAATARRLQDDLAESVVYGLHGRVGDADVYFESTAQQLDHLFAQGVPIVAFCAVGIVVRALASSVGDKASEPPVVAVSENGRFAVPLLGGHRGANRLADSIALRLGGIAAVTTAGDSRFGVALDDPPSGWSLANPAQAKDVAAALLSGAQARLQVEAGEADWLRSSALHFVEGSDASITIHVTDRHREPTGSELVYHPPVLALGVGCERNTDPREVIELALATLSSHNISPAAVACVVSVDVKMDEPAVHALATELKVPARFFTAERLEQETPRLANPSDIVYAEVGCHGVAEGAALAATGASGTLLVAKTRSARATCAIARASADIDASRTGRARGRLSVIGIGPGKSDWRTPEATRVLVSAEIVVGYRLYLELLGPLIDGKVIRGSALGEETERVRIALDLAAAGNNVALISSGDAGIYALATLVFELLAAERSAEWNRIAVQVVPGVSALQAAASRCGAPLGHDFCAISLSDLLTPWPVIEHRLRAAADGDFVVALFNPASENRRHQLPAARDILVDRRGPETPVIIARNLGRGGEKTEVTTLGALACDAIDMLTLLIVGNSQSRTVDVCGNTWVFTPRGYLDAHSITRSVHDQTSPKE